MKKILLFLSVLIFVINISLAQNRNIARGATSGELYLTSFWYGIYYGPSHDTLRVALHHITENGKKLTIQYDEDYFADEYTPPDSFMLPDVILADATSGVVYNKVTYPNGASLWVSFDYGKNWIFREVNIGSKDYYVANFDGLIYRGGGGVFKSINFGEDFTIVEDVSQTGKEPGLMVCEFFNIILRGFQHTINCYLTYSVEKTIDEQFVFGQVGGVFPDVYRGGKEGEVYVSSMFPEGIYKVSFSADTGHTFRHVYTSDVYHPLDIKPIFMSDREPGVFYIIHHYEVADTNSWGWHTKICIDYYRDYGETLVATYCHDLTKDYGKSCEPVNDLVSEKIDNNSILLTWGEPESSLPVTEYHVYRNDELLSVTTNTTFVDENLSVGEYEYCVITNYEMNCVSDSSNHVVERIGVGINENFTPHFSIVPNPATSTITISSATPFNSVEIINLLGQTLVSQSVIDNTATLNISNLNNGIYFVRVVLEGGSEVKKLVKQ